MYNKPKLWRNCGQSINSLRHPLLHELLPVPVKEKRDAIADNRPVSRFCRIQHSSYHSLHFFYSRLQKMRFSLSLSAEQCYNKADICHFRQHQYEYNRCLIFSIRVKEKQVRFLYEPVTVNGELEAMRICAVTGNRREGSLKRAEIPRTHKPGNLPVISAGMFLSQGHADLVALLQVVPDGFFLMEKFPKETAAFTRLKTSPAQRPIYSMEAFFSVKMSADAGIYSSPGHSKIILSGLDNAHPQSYSHGWPKPLL